MKSILTKITMGLLCTSLTAAPAGAAIERKAKPATETTTTTAADAVATAASGHKAMKLSRADKRESRKAIMKALRMKDSDTNLIIAVLITIFIGFIGPAIGMYIHEGEWNSRVTISLILGLLGHLPGIIYNLIIFFGAD